MLSGLRNTKMVRQSLVSWVSWLDWVGDWDHRSSRFGSSLRDSRFRCWRAPPGGQKWSHFFNFKCLRWWGLHNTEVAYLLLIQQPRFDSWHSQEFFYLCLEQRLDNVNQTHLVLVSGKLVLQKNVCDGRWLYTEHLITFSRYSKEQLKPVYCNGKNITKFYAAGIDHWATS